MQSRLPPHRIDDDAGRQGRIPLLCEQILEVFDGSTEVALRLTVQPEKAWKNGDSPFSN
jgi:hypothetical protein